MQAKQPEVEEITKTGKRRKDEALPTPTSSRYGRRSTPRKPSRHSANRTPEPEFVNPRVAGLFNKWRGVWLMAMDRRRKLQDALDRLNEAERARIFDYDDWRRRFMRWMNHNRTRIMDHFRRQDKDHDGHVTREEFFSGLITTSECARTLDSVFFF